MINVNNLYVAALTSFYDSTSNKTNWSQFDYLNWYDLCLSKSNIDYMTSKLIIHTTTLIDYTNKIYKYEHNKTNILTLTSMILEYVSTKLNYIIQFIIIPLQNIITIKDNELINDDILSSFRDGDILIDKLLSSNNDNEYTERIKNIQNKWTDNNINTVINNIVDEYKKLDGGSDIKHNTNLMIWARSMTIDEQNEKVLELTINAILIIKNIENVVTCLIQESKIKNSTLNAEKTIQHLLTDIDNKLNALHLFSVYSLKYYGKYIISNLWDNVIKNINNIFNVINWLNCNVTESVIPYWPNDVFCDKMYIQNLVQLASVSSKMLYRATLKSIERALKPIEVTDVTDKPLISYIWQDLKCSKNVYRQLLYRIMKYININMEYIESNFKIKSELNQYATQEMVKIIKYKIFVCTEIITLSLIQGEYYGTTKPQNIPYYTKHFEIMKDIFLMYFHNKIKIIPNNLTSQELIEIYEDSVESIYIKLVQMPTINNHEYSKLLKFNLDCAKHMFTTIVTALKKEITLDNDQELKRRLNIAVALITEEFIRYQEYIKNTNETSRLYCTRYLYSISVIDITQINTKLEYEDVYDKMQTETTQNSKYNITQLSYPDSQEKTENTIIKKSVTPTISDGNGQITNPTLLEHLDDSGSGKSITMSINSKTTEVVSNKSSDKTGKTFSLN